jgi:uncharacterized protein YggE
VKLSNLTILDRVVDDVLLSGANRFDGVSFSKHDLQTYTDNIIGRAVEAAKTQAGLIVVGLPGVRLGKPRTVVPDGVNTWGPAGDRSEHTFYAQSNEGSGHAVPSIPLGTIPVSYAVSIVFDLEDAP